MTQIYLSKSNNTAKLPIAVAAVEDVLVLGWDTHRNAKRLLLNF